MAGLFNGPIVSETICGALEKESLATKYVKYFEKNSLQDCKSHSPNLEPDSYK